MKKIIGIILIVAAGFIVFMGVQKQDENTASLKIGELELSAQKKDNSPLILMITGAAVGILGIYMLRQKN